MSRRVHVLAAAGALFVALMPLRVDAAGWWEPLAFAGHDVTAVTVVGGSIDVSVDGRSMASGDRGVAFAPSPAVPTAASPGPTTAGGLTWAIAAGRVLTGGTPSSLHPDPRAPFLGDGARFIAAPGAVPGLVLAVGTDGHVWRRGPDGAWTTAFVLMPAGGIAGPPSVTGLEAFTAPLSPAVYLATAGEGVLLTDDGGADWIRTDGAGLPLDVRAIAADNATQTLYAATADGLWAHHLQSFPQPPAYTDASLWLRWLGVAAVAIVASAAAVVALRRSMPPGLGEPRVPPGT